MRASRARKVQRYLLPVVCVVVLAFLLFPSRVLSVFGAEEAGLVAERGETVVTLRVPGMT